jgi:hypothetical protein
MYTKIRYLLIILGLTLGSARISAQSFDAQQLLLDWQKLTELKGILTQLQQGYQVLSTGYENIRTIAEASFTLHNSFLSALLSVNPAVKNDPRVQGIIGFQSSIATEYSASFNRFKQDKHFSAPEIAYLETVYNNVLNQSLSGITNLTNVLTPNTFRMSDDERLRAIEGIYQETKNQLLFLRSFNNSATMLAIDRAIENNDAETAKKLYGLE